MSYTIREMRLDELEQARAFAAVCELELQADCELIHHLSVLAFEAQKLIGLAAAVRCDRSGVVYKLAAQDAANRTRDGIESDMLDKLMVKSQAIHGHRMRLKVVEKEAIARCWTLDDWTPEPDEPANVNAKLQTG